jgi:hypothetical protein
MQLESARNLKRRLTETLLRDLLGPVHRRALGMAARPVATAVGGPATIALGIARRTPRDYRLAVRVQQRGLEDSRHVDLIKKKARREVDIRYIGRVAKREVPWYQRRTRPLRIGCSVGHYNVTAGTLGCFVVQGDRIYILSNNHVLADENRARKGDAILQPGKFDGGRRPADVVGKLDRFVKLKATGRNSVDCAIASVGDDVKYSANSLTGIGKLAGLADEFLDEGAAVAKVGRTTGTTRGRVTAFELDNVVVAYDLGNLRFDGQVEVESTGDGPFSQGGDSGSLIVNAQHKGVALLFAGSDLGGSDGQGLTYANPLGAVLEALKVRLVY